MAGDLVERLRAMDATTLRTCSLDCAGTVAEAAAEIARLTAENEGLRKAAEPFAEFGRSLRDHVHDDKLIRFISWTAGQYRALAAADSAGGGE